MPRTDHDEQQSYPALDRLHHTSLEPRNTFDRADVDINDSGRGGWLGRRTALRLAAAPTTGISRSPSC